VKQYLNLLQNVLDNRVLKQDRTGTGTLSVFGTQSRYDLSSFPLLTTKKVHLKSIIHELLWFLNGDTNIKYLNDNGVKIWDEWADNNGELGKIYGYQWRNFGGDQIADVERSLKENPYSRRHIVSAWNAEELFNMALPPCHVLFQFYVADNKLSCQLYQRSGDLGLGVPFNIASYALLTMMMAQVTGYNVGEFIHTVGDAHIYLNHIEQVNLQLKRDPRELPKMVITPHDSIFDYSYEDFKLINYNPHPHIKMAVSV